MVHIHMHDSMYPPEWVLRWVLALMQVMLQLRSKLNTIHAYGGNCLLIHVCTVYIGMYDVRAAAVNPLDCPLCKEEDFRAYICACMVFHRTTRVRNSLLPCKQHKYIMATWASLMLILYWLPLSITWCLLYVYRYCILYFLGRDIGGKRYWVKFSLWRASALFEFQCCLSPQANTI